jgi:hypothetical protein
MTLKPSTAARSGFLLLALSGGFSSLGAQPLQRTETLCGPAGAGQVGTNWISLASDGVIATAEQLCLAVTPLPFSVAQVYPDPDGRYTYDCAAGTCTSSGPVPEPDCTASSCFCVDPGEGVEIRASADMSTLDVYGCDSLVTIDIPIVAGTSPSGALVSVPFNTFLSTANDLGLYFGLPSSGLSRGTVTSLDCETGEVSSCQVGTSLCIATSLVPGRAYRLNSPTTATYSATNPVTCQPPGPPASACPIDGLAVAPSGGDNLLTWNPPAAGCALPLAYEVARFDPGCLVHYCKPCPGCVTLGPTMDTTLTDTPPPGDWAYLVRVVGGTWNNAGTSQCTDRDLMLGFGCPP